MRFALEMLGDGIGSRLHAFRKPYTEYSDNVKHRSRWDACSLGIQ